MPSQIKVRQNTRQQIAILWQIGKKTVRQIQRRMKVSEATVNRWKNVPFSDPDNFADKPRSGRKFKITELQQAKFQKSIEKEGYGNIKQTAIKFKISRRTVINTIKRLGGKIQANKKVISLSDRDVTKRLQFALSNQNEDFKKWSWFDDKSLEVPSPPPNSQNCPQYRFPGSRKTRRVFKTQKKIIKVMTFVGVNYQGKSEPIFNVKKIKMKRPRKSDGVVGYRYETFTVNTEIFLDRLQNMVIPFMMSTNSTKLALDNAPCQANKKVLEVFRNIQPSLQSGSNPRDFLSN